MLNIVQLECLQMTTSIPEIKTMLDKDIECLVEWLCVNKLTLNVIKAEYMLIGSWLRISSLLIA